LPRPDGQGRVPVVEILVNVPAVANLIREGKTHQIASAMQTGRAHGMVTFDGAVHDLIQKNLISRDDGLNFLRRRSAGKPLNGSSSSSSPIRLANSAVVV
jgi:twitching motility protein PilT